MDKRNVTMEKESMKLVLKIEIDEEDLPKSIDLKKATKTQIIEFLSTKFYYDYIHVEAMNDLAQEWEIVEDERDIGRSD